MKKITALLLVIAFMALSACKDAKVPVESENGKAYASEISSKSDNDNSFTTEDNSEENESGENDKMNEFGSVYILGDSYSTFEDCIPEGYEAWYKNGGTDNTDVKEQGQTWWSKLLKRKNGTLLKNNSFSGTTICNTGYGGAYCKDTSFIGRFEADIENGFFSSSIPDTVIIFGGTNDSWADSPIGEIKWDAFSDEDLKKVLPAFCYLLTRVKDALPNASVIVVVNTELKSEITFGLVNACLEKEIKCVRLKNISKQNGHPNIEGMKQICEQIETATLLF